MKRRLALGTDQYTYNYIQAEFLDKGYILDPALTDGKPYRLEAATVWPLVLYESEEEKPRLEEKGNEFDDVLETREIPHGEIPEGFKVHAIYQKNLIVVRRRVKEEAKP